jgi:hypothetical protein
MLIVPNNGCAALRSARSSSVSSVVGVDASTRALASGDRINRLRIPFVGRVGRARNPEGRLARSSSASSLARFSLIVATALALAVPVLGLNVGRTACRRFRPVRVEARLRRAPAELSARLPIRSSW